MEARDQRQLHHALDVGLEEEDRAQVGDERRREAQEVPSPVLAELRILASTDFDSRSTLSVVLAGDARLTQQFFVSIADQLARTSAGR